MVISAYLGCVYDKPLTGIFYTKWFGAKICMFLAIIMILDNSIGAL